MKFNKHLEYEGQHAFLSASGYHWLNYTQEHLIDVYNNSKAKEKGTLLHQFACDAIAFGIPLMEDGSTLSMYVNDCISDGMSPEIVLYYSPRCFGTADAISFDEDNNILRIYDLKTGKTKASIKQLYIYAAQFCLEYAKNPNDLTIHLRIYQNGEVFTDDPTGETIWGVMDTIIGFDNLLNYQDSLNEGGQ